MTGREAAARLLGEMRREESYSNLLLEKKLADMGLSSRDAALTARLVYGVTERQITLDWYLAAFCDRPLKKLHPLVLDTLRVAAYQILYLTRIPASAAVNEAVSSVKRRQPYAAGLVNGALHALIRQKDQLSFPEGDEGLSVRYSCPIPLIRLWREAYGEEILEGILSSLNGAPPAYLRVNTLITDPLRFCEALDAAGIGYRIREELPALIEVFAPAGLKSIENSCRSGYYYQDMASQYCCRALEAAPGDRVADVCAAPGGKSFTAAQYMQNRGEIWAGDIYPAKCEEMKRRGEALGIRILHTVCRDASLAPGQEVQGTFDRVICDVPCSGLGVIRRKPEVRYKPMEAIEALPSLQLNILEESAKLVKPGGVLQYSTCTLNPKENGEVAAAFLHSHPEFSPRPLSGLPASVLGEPDWQRTLFSHCHGTDGFFIAGFVKGGEGG